MSTFPKFSMDASSFPKFLMNASGGNPPRFGKGLTAFEEPVFPQDIIIHPQHERKTNSSDYDYEEPPSTLEIIRDRLEELKLGWPLSDDDEDKIEERNKKSRNPQEIDTLIIKEAYLKADDVQKKIIVGIADKLHYTL